MRKLAKFALAGAAATALAGTAYAAGKNAHVMDVALPDGAVAHIQYYGDVAPKVTIAPRAEAGMPGLWAPMAFPNFEGLDQAIARMNQETEAMMRQAQTMAAHPGAPGLNVASYGNMPAGANSVSVVSYSNGGRTCTRTTQSVSEGPGKPPKVTTSVSGDCGPAAAAPAPQAAQPTGPLSHT
jgi:hypothetical protein